MQFVTQFAEAHFWVFKGELDKLVVADAIIAPTQQIWCITMRRTTVKFRLAHIRFFLTHDITRSQFVP